MLLNTSNIAYFFSNNKNSIYSQLSDSGKKSVSWNFIDKSYQMGIDHYNIIDSSLRVKRDMSSVARLGINQNKLHISPRLKYELTCLITTLLKNLEKFDMDKLINQDAELTDEDKVILKKAFYSLTKNIEIIYNLLGEPCFGREKIEEENKDSNPQIS